MTTRRAFLVRGGAVAALGVGGLAVGRIALSDGAPSPRSLSANAERVGRSLQASIGHEFDLDQLGPFVDHLDAEHDWIWDEGVPVEAADRVICTQFVMTSSLAVNGMDVLDYQFFGDEIVCNPYARFG